MKRHTKQPSDPTPAPDVAALREQLRLARAQNAYLHRELATALKQAPLAATSFDGDIDTLFAENASLRERLATLTLHYRDLERRHKGLQQTSHQQHKDYKNLQRFLFGCLGDTFQLTMVDDQIEQSLLFDKQTDLAKVLKILLMISHPDRWSRGQPASELAHELTVFVNGAGARLEGVQA